MSSWRRTVRPTWRSGSTSSAAEQRLDLAGAGVADAIGHALAAFPPGLARRAAGLIRLVLGGRLASDRADAWRACRLTGDGFPFELAFCTGDDRLRFTVEPDDGGLDPRTRLDVAGELARVLDQEPLPPEVLDEFRAMQAGASLAWGTWIGCRVGAEHTAVKLYAEVPPGAKNASPRARRPALTDRIVVPRMLAYTPSTRAFEAYFRVPSLEPRHLPAVLAPAGMEAHASWLADFVQDTYGHAIRGRLPGPSVGVSYVVGPARGRVTLHFYARALWGSDARIRRGWSRLAAGLGWDDQAYLRVTRPLAARESWRTFHGMVGITLDEPPRIAVSIGVRPVVP
jgi:hypothetical protein